MTPKDQPLCSGQAQDYAGCNSINGRDRQVGQRLPLLYKRPTNLQLSFSSRSPRNLANFLNMARSSGATPSGSKCITSFLMRPTLFNSSVKVFRSIGTPNFSHLFGFSKSRMYSPSVKSETSSIWRPASDGSHASMSSALWYL